MSGHRDLGRSWDIADKQIRGLTERIALAERGLYKGNPAVMRDMRDKWLEYRYNHDSDDRSRL